jgi:hypothetical protein
MTAYLLVNHLLNFAAPALFLALGLALACRLLPMGRRASAPGLRRQVLVLLGVNLIVSTAAFLLLGQDGKLMGYAAMTVGAAFTQWWLLRGWKV